MVLYLLIPSSLCWFLFYCKMFHWGSLWQITVVSLILCSVLCPLFSPSCSIDLEHLFSPSVTCPIDHSRLHFISASWLLSLGPVCRCFSLLVPRSALYLAISRTLPIIHCSQAESLRLIFSFSPGVCESQHLAWPIDLLRGMDQSVYWCISLSKRSFIADDWAVYGKVLFEAAPGRTHHLVLSRCSGST